MTEWLIDTECFMISIHVFRVKLKRSNTTISSNHDVIGQSPNLRQPPSSAARLARWSLMESGSNCLQAVPSQSNSRQPPAEELTGATYCVCLDCKAVIENISSHKKEQQAAAAAAATEAAVNGSRGGPRYNLRPRSSHVPIQTNTLTSTYWVRSLPPHPPC